MVSLGAKKDTSSSGIISSLNRSPSVASELPHVWFGVLDADQGWVNQLDIYLTNLFGGRQKGEVVFFPHRATDLWDWRKESLSLDYESSVFQDWPARLCIYSFNCIYAEPGAVGIVVNTQGNEWAKVLGVQWKRQILEQTHYYTTQAGK